METRKANHHRQESGVSIAHNFVTNNLPRRDSQVCCCGSGEGLPNPLVESEVICATVSITRESREEGEIVTLLVATVRNDRTLQSAHITRRASGKS
jgi:hypothetical protein